MTRKVIFAIALIGALFLAGWFIYRFKYESWDFRNNLWAPAYLLAHSRPPYRIGVLFDNSNAIWFPQIIGLLFPLGWLPQNQAANLWLIVNILTVIGLTILLMQRAGQKKPTLFASGLVILGVILFPPSLTDLTLGQIDFLLIAALVACAYGIEKRALFLPAFCIAIALTKPQVCFLVIPGLFISLLWKRQWKYGIHLAGLSAALALLLTIPLWIVDSSWGKDLISNLRSNPDWLQPALFSRLQVQFGGQGLIIWLCVALACFAASTILWDRLPPRQAVLWSLAMTTLAAPYLWSWDFTLLLPLFVAAAAQASKKSTRLVLFLNLTACFFISIWSLRLETSDVRFWWLPLVMFPGLVAAWLLENKGIHKIVPANLEG